MENPNPTASEGGASTADPIDRLQQWLDADTGGQSDNDGDEDPSKESAAEAPKGGDQQEDTEPQITTAQLAKFLGVDESLIDVDEQGEPFFKPKIDGAERTAKLPELLKDYQLRGHAENQVRAAAERERALQAREQEALQQAQARFQQLDQQLQNAADIANAAHQVLSHEYSQVNWVELWRTDPGQAGLLEKQFQQRNAQIQQNLQRIAGERNAAMQRQQADTQAGRQRYMQAQEQRLVSLVPEWQDSSIKAKEVQDIVAWANKAGIGANDIDVSNAAHVYLLRRAWQQDTLQRAKPEIESKVRAAPKLVKPGQAPAPVNPQTAQLKHLKQQIRTTGGNSTKAVADLLMAKGLA